MPVRLRLLDRVTWDDAPIPGDRPAALLATLASHPHGLPDERIVDEVWRDDPPAKATKALQVIVSRLRSLERRLVVRHDGGYRLGLDPDEVDVWVARDQQASARQQLDTGDAAGAARTARLATDGSVGAPGAPGPLAELRDRAARDRRAAERVLALALARSGASGEALPLLVALHDRAPDDTDVLASLLRAEREVSGPAAALSRYAAYRADVGDRLGVEPDPELQRLHRELLAADAPVHTGVQYDSDDLLGRDEDLGRLRSAMATGRLTTVLGPGGIGKTRIVHVLAREATQPRVHVVELVGVASGDDVVAEVGAALGIRGSVTTRHALTPAQQADVRGRIAQELDSGPTLLVLDNCEHVLEAAAGLVAFLLVTTRDLSVLATSRAPLRIAAERVVPLTQLAPDHAADLFTRRARAVRPDARLDPAEVTAVVERLDGLPLAIELAAARIRTMSVEEIRAALDDRFGLLRSRDRTAPERHRTLTAVIGWSWDLLTDGERDAAATMSVFHDGFDAATARSVLGPASMDLVEALVDQSIVTVDDAAGRTRFRMLETIREFTAARLVDSGRHDEALARQQAWALELVGVHGEVFFAAKQVESVEALLAEENNLTDVLRRAVADDDALTMAELLGSLGALWTITGNHARIFAVADAAATLLSWWRPEDERAREAGFVAAALLLVHLNWIPGRDSRDLREAVASWGEPTSAWARAARAMFVVHDERAAAQRLVELADAETDPQNTAMLLMWAAIMAENDGDVAQARAHTLRALEGAELTPYVEASLHSELSQLASYEGDHHLAAHHAELAWPTLMRLHAYDDASALRFTTAVSLLLDGDLEGCERMLGDVGELDEGGQLGSRMLLRAARAELALARGDLDAGFAAYDRALSEVMVEIPGWSGALTPWVLIAASGALGAHVLHAPGGAHARNAPGRSDPTGSDPVGPVPTWSDARADELAELVLGPVPGNPGPALPLDDLPLGGVGLVAVGGWALRRGALPPVDEARQETALRLLAIARAWAYNQSLPSLRWERFVALADEVPPGRLDELQAEYVGRPGPDLVPEAVELLRSLTSSG